MNDNDLRKLSRADLLEMLIEQSQEVEILREKLAAAEEALQKREIAIRNAGSIAEASLQLNGVFEAAQSASQQYLENIERLSRQQEAFCQQLEKESVLRAEQRIAEAVRKCEKLEADTKIRCAEMLNKAKADSKACWDEIEARLNTYYEEHRGLRELLAMALPAREQE